ncbi:hypothetical protein INT43_005859 [Umbelopsis isabellina]|uniref:UBA domain-containing protein n=1 Tax=Mortierella isabellina TaxID=91625 RepID=A0A8H7PIU5_MORIS|nr:hypothetical protein INT43_005859 [Umbelopsis isabellina]
MGVHCEDLNNNGFTGFYNAPVTKMISLGVGACSLLASVLNVKPYLHLQLTPHLTTHHQFWRLLVSHLAFANSSDLLFGGLIVYHMRVVERQFGTPKYVAFIAISWVLSTLLEIGALVMLSKLGLRSIPAGPFAILFAMLYQYHRIIPSTYKFKIFGATLSDKMYIYVIATHLMLSQSLATLAPALCGLFAGALYRSDIVGIKRWRFPRVLSSFASRVVLPLIASAPAARSTATTPEQRAQSIGLPMESMMASGIRNRRQAGRPGQARAGVDSTMREYIGTLAGRAPEAGTSARPPSEEHIAILMTMFPGQTRESVINALATAHNDLNRAVEIMLSSG